MGAIITLSILAILVLYLGLFKAKKALLPVSLLGLLGAGAWLVLDWNTVAEPLYNGMILFDRFSIVFSVLCISVTCLVLLLSKDYFDKISGNVAEYYTLIIFSLLGGVIITAYHNLSMLFIGVEIMSVALYILAGIRKRDFSSNEAALKYFLMGAFSTGFLLFGITLLYGATGSFDIATIREYVVDRHEGVSSLFYAGILFMIVGLCFKVGAAPFHFWTPDVYDGSPMLITTFMSTTVKIAAFAAFLRLFSYSFEPLKDFWAPVLLVITFVTLFVGNITALVQHSFKRMLAYSSISHVGYMLFAVVALGASSTSSVLVYVGAYSFASIIGFGSLILVKRATGSDDFESYNGLAKKNPMLAFVVTIGMLSFAGIPLTAGFIGKMMMFTNVLKDYQVILVLLAVLNAAMGVFYYFRVIVCMYFKTDDREQIVVPFNYQFVFLLSAILILIFGVFPGFITALI